jgi:hypothetical protein
MKRGHETGERLANLVFTAPRARKAPISGTHERRNERRRDPANEDNRHGIGGPATTPFIKSLDEAHPA